jgi:hypothetical protein
MAKGVRGGHWLESDGGRAFWGAVHDQVVFLLNVPPGAAVCANSIQVQVQDQASVERAPVLCANPR